MDADPRPGTLDLDQTVLATLGIELLEASSERVVAAMEVGPRVHQPYGLLHGGVSVVLAETVMSVGAVMAAGGHRRVVGIEINANHVRSVRTGRVVCTGTPVHVGRTTQVWQSELRREDDNKLVSTSRCTLAVLDD